MLSILLFLLNGAFAQAQYSWVQVGADIDGEALYGYLGRSVSLSSNGSVMAIGAPFDSSGRVRVYQYSSESWVQLGAEIGGETPSGSFGWAVKLSSDGSVVAIGDPYGAGTGQVRVHQYLSGSWVQLGAHITCGSLCVRFGNSVSLSSDGTVVAIGAPTYLGGSLVGRVRVHQYLSGSWVQLGTDIDGEGPGEFGWEVSLSSDGSVVAIGDPTNGDAGPYAGQVRVYQYVSGSWVQLGAHIDGETPWGIFGYSVSLSSDGSVMAIGAPYNSDGSYAGHVRVYQYVSGSWVQLGADIDGEGPGGSSGWSVSLSSDGSVVAIGDPTNGDAGSFSGQVRVYQYVSGSWVQLGADIDGEGVDVYSGWSVSLSSDGSVVAIGIPNYGEDWSNKGQVRVYSYPIQKFNTPSQAPSAVSMAAKMKQRMNRCK